MEICESESDEYPSRANLDGCGFNQESAGCSGRRWCLSLATQMVRLLEAATTFPRPIRSPGTGSVYCPSNLPDSEPVKDIHLIIENQGYRPAKGCEAPLDIFEEGEEIPKPIRLGWRKRPPMLYKNLDDWEMMRQRTAPFDITRKSQAQLDLLRLRTREDRLTTLSSFRSDDFEKDTEYRLDRAVTSSNANPQEISLRLNWDGGHDDASLREAITVVT